MKNLSIMIKPASSLCNMRCQYCFYKDVSSMREVQSYGIMQEETVKIMLEHIYQDLERGDQITFAFQGGEPTLAGLEFYRKFVELVNQWNNGITISYALQTNGILIDEEWCQFLKQQKFLVGISYDIIDSFHDEARKDCSGKATSKSVLHAIQLFKEFEIDYNILCTLTNKIAKEPQVVWRHILELDLEYVQFTPCLNELKNKGNNEYALTPELFASFYIRMFSMWLKHYRKGKYRSIKLFDDIVNYVATGIPTACGMNGSCQPQIVVEADGSVYPCDFYCMDQYRIGSFCNESIREIYEKSAYFSRSEKKPIPKLCKQCKFINICRGGCKRMRETICVNKNQSYCGYQKLLQVCIQDIIEIVEQEILRKRM